MTIQQCKYILKVAELGSLNEAAKQLFIAQSTLSESIKQLETELGIKVFERSNRGVILTEDGAEFVRYAGQMLAQNDFIINRFCKDCHRKTLYIATQHYDFIADIFVNYLNTFTEDDYTFSLREMKTYDIIHEVENALSDIGIIAIKESGKDIMERYLASKGIAMTTFLKTVPHVFLSTKHKLAGKTTLGIAELQEFPYVFYEQGMHNSDLFTEELIDSFFAQKQVEITDRATLMNVLMATNCYTIGTGIMPSALNNGSIVSIPLEGGETYTIGYILKSDKKQSMLMKTFLDRLNEFGTIYK